MKYHMAGLAVLSLLLGGCSPTVQIKAPKKPIVVNLNVKVKHDVRVKVERDVDAMLAREKDLF
ncbi:MAG: YnbE family lipoprotein [Gammaproteobacteria bacterium]|jgi:hypothetical protein